MAEPQIVFITGVGRSGTTLLQSMLHAHSQVHFPPETHFFKRHILPFMLKGRLPTREVLQEDGYLQRLSPAFRQMVLQAQLFLCGRPRMPAHYLARRIAHHHRGRLGLPLAHGYMNDLLTGIGIKM